MAVQPPAFALNAALALLAGTDAPPTHRLAVRGPFVPFLPFPFPRFPASWRAFCDSIVSPRFLTGFALST